MAQKFNILKKVGNCKTHRENSVALRKGNGEFELYRKMSEIVRLYRMKPEVTIEEALEQFSAWLLTEYEVTSAWQRESVTKRSLEKMERYLKACPEKSVETYPISFKFAGEEYNGFRPEYSHLELIPFPRFMFLNVKQENMRILHLSKFSPGKQKISAALSGRRTLESSVTSHPFTLGCVFYALELFKPEPHEFWGLHVSFDALTSPQDEKLYKEEGKLPNYTENVYTKDSRSGIYFVFRGKVLLTVSSSSPDKGFYRRTSYHKDFFPYFKKLIEEMKNGEKCAQADCEKCSLYNRCHYTEPPIALPEAEERTFSVEDIKLSEEQEKIVSAKNGIFRVLATAGSGKTFCMVLRIIRLIEDGAEPSSMLLISFSNIAVDELKSRIEKMLHVFGYDEFVDVNDFTIVTFNSLGNTLVKEYFDELGFEYSPGLLDNIDQYDIIGELIRSATEQIDGLDYDNPFLKFGSNCQGVVAKLASLFDEIKRQRISCFADYDEYLGLTEKIHNSPAGEATVAAQEERAKYRKIFKEFERYSEMFKERNLVDYADQSILVEKLIAKSFEDGIDYVLEKFDFEHIIVDEFQDSNEFQLSFVKSLMGSMRFRSLMVVGDDAQAIYSFNNTSPENIINFDKKLGIKVTDLALTETRRFGQDVCDIANAVLEKNTEKVDKKIYSTQPISEFKPRLIGFDSKATEYDYIAEECRKLIDSGVRPEDIIFLSTRNDDFSAMMKSMNKAGVPALKLSEKFIVNSRVIAMIALAKFILDFDDTISLMDYLNAAYGNTFFNFSSDEVEKLVEREKKQFLSLFIPMSDKKRLEFFCKLLESIDISGDLTAKAFLEKVLDKAKACNNVYSLAAYLLKYERYQSEDEVKLTGRYPAVTLSTVWKAKGGEWDYVFCSLSSVDSARGLNRAELEEKRRLIFTMITRMKKGLTVTSMKNLSRRSTIEGEETIPNRFYGEMKEIPGFDKLEIADVKKSKRAAKPSKDNVSDAIAG